MSKKDKVNEKRELKIKKKQTHLIHQLANKAKSFDPIELKDLLKKKIKNDDES